MSKELREMLQALEEKKAKVRALLSEDKMTDTENLMAEVRSLQKKIENKADIPPHIALGFKRSSSTYG